MEVHDIQQILNRLDMAGIITPTHTLTSAVTTAWGVDWDEVYIARDLMQNFFDANREHLESVIVRNINSDVLITAPSPFKLERLFYLGSEKGDNDIGQYGEGFKVAATCLLRDHNVTPIVLSGRDIVALRVSSHSVADTQMYPVEYDFFLNDKNVPGTILILPKCPKKLAKALTQGLTHFFYDQNSLLGNKRWSDRKNEFSIYDSTDGRGHIFYRKLKRGEIEGIPLVLVIDKEYKAIEKKIGKDRDRNAFGEEVMKLFYKYFGRNGLNYHTSGQEVVVRAAQSCWGKGHPLLSEIAETTEHSHWRADITHRVFGDKYYARSGNHASNTDPEKLEINRLDRLWQEEGRMILPGYFHKFGVPCAEIVIKQTREKANEESRKNNQRIPTNAEQKAIRLLSKVLEELAPEIIAVLNKKTTRYTVARTEVVLGQLKSDRSFHSREVFLAESVFENDFPHAIAVFLHEHAHIFGYDGSRGFTDALTELLETVVRQRHDLDQYQEEWESVRILIQNEREELSACNQGQDDEWLKSMTKDELRDFVARVPLVILNRLRREQQKKE